MHVQYNGDDDLFVERYGKSLRAESAVLQEVLAEVRRQREERLQAPAEAAARASCCERMYKRLVPQVYTLDPPTFLASGFRELVSVLALSGSPGCSVDFCVRKLKAKGLL